MIVLLDETIWLWQEPATGIWHLSPPHIEFTDLEGKRRAALGLVGYPVKVIEKGQKVEVILFIVAFFDS